MSSRPRFTGCLKAFREVTARRGDIAFSDKNDDLLRTTAALVEGGETVLRSIEPPATARQQNERELATLRRAFEKETILLKREIEDFKKWREEQRKERDEWSRRLWAFGPNLVGALISGIIAAAVAYFISRH